MTSVLLGFLTNLFLASHSTTSQIHPDSTLGHQNSPKTNGNEANTDDVCMIYQVAFVTSVVFKILNMLFKAFSIHVLMENKSGN